MNLKQVRQIVISSFVCSVAVLATVSTSLAQTPFTGTTAGRPDAGDLNRGGKNATVIYANSDGGNDANEFLYFKVYTPGGGSNWGNYDWYTSPTAWLDPANFHFSNVNLRMYKNNILVNKGGVLEFGADQIKEANAGKIGYGQWTPGLNIVGGNPVGSSKIEDRRVVVFAEGGTLFSGAVTVTGQDNGTFAPPKKLANGADLSTYKLFVNGGVLAKEVRVNSSWADYVFAPGYQLKSLEKVEQQIRTLGHLPGMPSAKEIETDGFSVGDMARLQQEKIEELTLYVITLKKEVEQLKAKISVKK